MFVERLLRRFAALDRPSLALAIGVLLCLTAFTVDWSLDDYTHRAMLDQSMHGIERPWWDLFRFFKADAEWERDARLAGMMPWYAQEGIRVGFFRPLTSATLALDHLLWRDSPLAAHAHSIAWFVAYLVAAMAVLRRLLPVPAAILACWALALDDSHGYLVGWIAQRNATVAATFAFWAFAHHLRWRDGEGRAHLVASMVLYAAALCGGEIGVEITPFVAAWALFRERGSAAKRLVGLVPMGVVTVAWLTFYSAMHYGSWGSGLYIDPISETGRFVVAALVRVPTLVLAQFTPIGADISLFLGESRSVWLAVGGVATFALITALARRSAGGREAAFWLFAMVVSMLPSAGTFPSNRMLVVGGVAGSAIVGLLGASLLLSGFVGARRLLASFVAINAFVLGPLMLPIAAWQVEIPASIYRCSAASMDAISPDLNGSSVVLFAAPDIFASSISVVTRAAWHVDRPDQQWVVHSGLGSVTLDRIAANELRVQIDRLGTEPIMDQLLRPADVPFIRGASSPLGEHLTVRVDDLDPSGWPDVVTLTAPVAFEDLGYVWATWTDDGYRPVMLPPIGASSTLTTSTAQGVFSLPFGRSCVPRSSAP